MAATGEDGALVSADFDVLHDGLALSVAHRRSHLRARVQAVADAQTPGPVDECREELLVDLLVDDHPAGRGASLPARAEAAPHTAFHRELEVRVVHHDDDVLASHLE